MTSAQCRTVKISILGDEGVPVQVDGEAWIQPPGYIRIVHKNRAQTLTRDRVRAIAHGVVGSGLPVAYSWPHLYIHKRGKSVSWFALGVLFMIQRLGYIVVYPIVSVIQSQEAS